MFNSEDYNEPDVRLMNDKREDPHSLPSPRLRIRNFRLFFSFKIIFSSIFKMRKWELLYIFELSPCDYIHYCTYMIISMRWGNCDCRLSLMILSTAPCRCIIFTCQIFTLFKVALGGWVNCVLFKKINQHFVPERLLTL